MAPVFAELQLALHMANNSLINPSNVIQNFRYLAIPPPYKLEKVFYPHRHPGDFVEKTVKTITLLFVCNYDPQYLLTQTKMINCRVSGYSSEKMIVKKTMRIKVSSTQAMQRILQVELPVWKHLRKDYYMSAMHFCKLDCRHV